MSERMYDPATVVTVSGVVESTDTVAAERGMGYGVHLKLKTDKETVSVHLGPGWFMEKQETKIIVGDTIEVKGSRLTMENAPVIIAAEVRKGSSILKLRDENGVPVWAGKDRGRGRSSQTD